MPAMSAGEEQQQYVQQQQYAQQQQIGPGPQQAYAPQRSNMPQPDQTGQTGGAPTPEPSAREPTISPDTGNQGSFTPTPVPAYRPDVPDMSEYIAGWQATMEQFYGMLPYIFSEQFGFMPSWPTWPQFIKTM